MNREGVVVLSAPRFFSQRAIKEALAKHEGWIAKHRARRLESIERAKALYAERAGLVPFFGEWIAPPSDPIGFYRNEARAFFTKECDRLAAAIGVAFNRIRIGDQKSRYGSCSAKGTLSFSWRIVKAPLFVARYIAAHEVAHLMHMNHKSVFYDCVASVAPDYKEAEKWLAKNGDFLRFDPC